MILSLAAAVSIDADASVSDGMRELDADATLRTGYSEDTLEGIIEQGMCL